MQNTFFNLNILTTMLCTEQSELEKLVKQPALMKVLVNRNLLSVDKDSLTNKFDESLDSIMDHVLNVFDSGLKTNSEVNEFLLRFVKQLQSNDLNKDRVKLATELCYLGNKPGLVESSVGVEYLVGFMSNLVEDLTTQSIKDEEVKLNLFKLEEAVNMLDQVQLFYLTKIAADNGVPEYSPSELAGLPTTIEPDPNLTIDSVTRGMFDDLVGVEDSFSGLDEKATDLYAAETRLNELDQIALSGNEGKLFDSIKEMGTKAYESLRKSLTAYIKSFTDSDIKSVGESIAKTGENNKKALAAIKEQNAVINDEAKRGIEELAKKSDPTGEMSKVVSGLRSIKDGGRVIDGLLGLVNKIVSSNSAVDEKFKEAEKQLEELRKSANAATKGDEDNKDVVATNKEKVQEDTKLAKEKLKAAKDAVGVVKKQLDGYKKAISGITPKIFIIPKEDE